MNKTELIYNYFTRVLAILMDKFLLEDNCSPWVERCQQKQNIEMMANDQNSLVVSPWSKSQQVKVKLNYSKLQERAQGDIQQIVFGTKDNVIAQIDYEVQQK